MNSLVIFGSARSEGNTKKALEAVLGERNVEVVNLLDKQVAYYSYERPQEDDDFLDIAQKIVGSDIIIFATPVYWYSMSAQMKTLFDRLTDLISLRKDLGRSLKGKTCYLVSTGTDEILPTGYEEVFERTAQYFDMQFGGSFYYHVQKGEPMNEETKHSAQRFGDKIFSD